VDIDFQKLTNTKGLSFHATGLWQTGVNVGDKLGSYANPSGIGSVHVFRMDSFWVQDTLASGRVTLRGGQMAGWDFFGNQEFGEAFIIEPLAYTFGNVFADTYLTYNPAGVPAAQVRIDAFKNRGHSPLTGIYVKTGVFSGNQNPYVQDPTGLHFKIRDSAVFASEAGYVIQGSESGTWQLPPDKKTYPGIYRFGGIVNPYGTFTNPLTLLPSRGNYLWYFEAAQAVYRAEAGSQRGLDLTFGYDHSPNDATQQNAMMTVAERYHGIIPSRTMDELDFGYVRTRTSNAASQYSEQLLGYPLGSENAFTVNYRAQLKPWFVFQPVAQYFENISGNPRRASGVVIGFRTYLRL
jgi:carbohydrate-selective porin OprB